jgi:hypothetical protein
MMERIPFCAVFMISSAEFQCFIQLGGGLGFFAPHPGDHFRIPGRKNLDKTLLSSY